MPDLFFGSTGFRVLLQNGNAGRMECVGHPSPFGSACKTWLLHVALAGVEHPIGRVTPFTRRRGVFSKGGNQAFGALFPCPPRMTRIQSIGIIASARWRIGAPVFRTRRVSKRRNGPWLRLHHEVGIRARLRAGESPSIFGPGRGAIARSAGAGGWRRSRAGASGRCRPRTHSHMPVSVRPTALALLPRRRPTPALHPEGLLAALGEEWPRAAVSAFSGRGGPRWTRAGFIDAVAAGRMARRPGRSARSFDRHGEPPAGRLAPGISAGNGWWSV